VSNGALTSIFSNPISASNDFQPSHGRPPAIQAVQRSMSRIADSGTGFPFAMSPN
jgi:hypothetical protein